MTSQKLYEILEFLDALDTKLNLQKTLESIKEALDELVEQPAQPEYQNALATALASFEAAAGKLTDLITPSQFEAIEDMGGYDFFDPAIAEGVKSSIQKNAMTPSVARDFVRNLAKRRAAFLATVSEARQSLEKLGVKTSVLQPGSADLAFLIPRDIFDNHLAAFAKELTFISRLMGHLSEALTGKAEQVELEQLSSSVPTVALVAGVSVISVLATIVNKFLDAWTKVEKIRKMRAELSDMGLRKTALDELTEEVTATVDEVVEEATELVLRNYDGAPERKNELTNAVRQDTHRLFGQIERGLTVEFRAASSKDEGTEQGKALANISNLSRLIQFPQIPKEPMLLANGQILEGDIQAVKRTKKTTTHKTTTSKKVVGKEEKPEAKEGH
jgi:hypothetical protein